MCLVASVLHKRWISEHAVSHCIGTLDKVLGFILLLGIDLIGGIVHVLFLFKGVPVMMLTTLFGDFGKFENF